MGIKIVYRLLILNVNKKVGDPPMRVLTQAFFLWLKISIDRVSDDINSVFLLDTGVSLKFRLTIYIPSFRISHF